MICCSTVEIPNKQVCTHSRIVSSFLIDSGLDTVGTEMRSLNQDGESQMASLECHGESGSAQ